VTKDEKIRILFVSDERMVRDALLAVFSGSEDMNVIGANEDVSGLSEPAGERLPDVIVVSIAGVRTAATIIRQALAQWPKSRVVVLSSFSNKAFVAEVLRAGAHGYITTRSTSHELLDAIRTVASGSTYLCSRMRQSILEGFVQGQADKVEADWPAVTDREATILQLLGEGRTSKEIAAAMNLSSKTIDACRRQLMEKLDVDSTAGLVKCAIALGLTSVDPSPAPAR